MSEAQRSEASDSTVRLERMVREAGWSGIYTQWVSPTERESMTVPVTPQQVLRFAAIVAAAEREECAKTCESIQAKTDKWGPMAGYCAEQIRMRSNAKAVGLDAAGGQSHTSDGLCGAVDSENGT